MAKGGRLVTDKAIIVGNPAENEIVYCYTFPSRRDRIKIGYSSRGVKRILEQSTGFPENPIVLFVIHHRDAVNIEPALHRALAHKQAKVLGNEWFEASVKDVLAVSPLLREALRKQRWKSIPRSIAALFMLSFGIFMLPVVAIALAKLYGGNVAGLRLAGDYLMSVTNDNVPTFDFGTEIVTFMWTSASAWWGKAMLIASPTAWVGLAYLSFKKQVA